MKKNIIITLLILLCAIPFAGAQEAIFDKYSDNPNVTYVSIKPKMFQMIAKMGIDVTDKQAESYINMVKSMTSFKTIVTDNAVAAADISKWMHSKLNTLEALMEVKEAGKTVEFYVKEGKDADHVKSLLIFVNGPDDILKTQTNSNQDTAVIKTIVVWLTGDIDLNEISRLTDKMNIPGGGHLKK